MTGKHRLFAAFATALLVVGAFSTGAVALGTTTGDGLAVDVSQSESVVVTVTDNGSAVENATVVVAPTNETSEVGSGEYVTDANGTVTLATPAQNVTVDVTATNGNETATTTVTLVGDEAATESDLSVAVSQSDSVTVLVTDNGSAVENASVAVEAPVVNNSTYAGVGDYTTGPNGTVDLATPEENVTITVAAEYGNQTVTTTATLVADSEPKNFGERVSSFVQRLKNASTDSNTTLGQLVSEFVTENNPGADHRPDHAGPTAAGPNHAGNGTEDDDRGRPAHAGNGHGNDKHDDETNRNENAKKDRGKK